MLAVNCLQTTFSTSVDVVKQETQFYRQLIYTVSL